MLDGVFAPSAWSISGDIGYMNMCLMVRGKKKYFDFKILSSRHVER